MRVVSPGRRWPALGRGLAAVVAVVVLVGCGPSGDPVTWRHDLELGLPAVEWPFGPPDVSNEWVAALVDANVALAVAHNSGDYSGAAIAQRVDPEHATMWAIRSADSAVFEPGESFGGGTRLFPGPTPLWVTHVSVDGDTATVFACTIDLGWDRMGMTVTQLRRSASGGPTEYEMRRDADGRIRLVGERQGEHPVGGCGTDDLRLGYFLPEPAYGSERLKIEVLGLDGLPVVESAAWTDSGRPW